MTSQEGHKSGLSSTVMMDKSISNQIIYGNQHAVVPKFFKNILLVFLKAI